MVFHPHSYCYRRKIPSCSFINVHGFTEWSWNITKNQGNHQDFDPSLLPKKLWLIFMGMKDILKNNSCPTPSFSWYFFYNANLIYVLVFKKLRFHIDFCLWIVWTASIWP
jgi:hypothetical protein